MNDRSTDNSAQVTTKKTVRVGVFTKLLFLAIASFIIAGLVTWVLALAIAELPEFRKMIGRENYTDILFLIFIIGFILSIASSAYAFLSKEELTGQVEIRRFESKEAKLWKEAMAPPKLTPGQKAALERAAAKRAGEEARLQEDGEGGPDDLDDVLAASGDDDEEAVEETPAVKLSINAEKQKVTVMTFLSKGLESVMQSRPKLDSFNKFGVNLYLAGACDAVGATENLSEEELRQILVDSVGVLGTKPDQAHKFAAVYDEYLMNPKYLGMIEAGREAMNNQIAGDPNAANVLEKALDRWNTKEAGEETSLGTIAVMFTDIVGSTDMTQTHGDAAAQEVVRTHNRIVRAALTTHSGKEVKHTGDGIMASFNNTAKAVEAGIYIQRKVAESNATNPDVPLGVKIGINAGEPIVEDDDLFGTTVQLSARIVDKATNYQILVSEVVKGICQGKSIEFVNRGAREMKGFKEPIILYEAIWQQGGE